MIIYRPHRGSLMDSINEVMEFENEHQMKLHIVKDWNGFIEYEDIVIGGSMGVDDRINWGEIFPVCTKRCNSEDYLIKYGCPQCIGMMAYENHSN